MSAPEQVSFLADAQPAGRPHEYPLPSNAHIEHCRSCGAQIVWGRTDLGKAVPLSLATVQTRDGTPYAVSHFRDCPDAGQWGTKEKPDR